MQLSDDEAHLWFAQPDGTQLGDDAFALLSKEEKQQRDRFHHAKDQDLFFLSRVMMRSVLSQYMPALPQCWKFGREEKGRLYIEEPDIQKKIHFSLTHTDGLVAMAVSRDRFIGVDAEPASRDLSILDIAPRVFTKNEIATINTSSESQRLHQFLRFWTLKEALCKALSLGFSMSFNQCELLLSDEPVLARCLEIENGTEKLWSFQEPDISQDHFVAMAFRSPTMVESIRWTPEFLQHRPSTSIDIS